MPASVYGDLGTVLWDLRGAIMSLSHYELGRKKIIAIIGVRLATTPIFAFLPLRLSGWAACPPLFICHNTPASKQEVSKAKLFALKCTFFLFIIIFQLCFCVAHEWLTPEFGYAVQPSSAVATRVSITVSAAETEYRKLLSLRNQSYSQFHPAECRQVLWPWRSCDRGQWVWRRWIVSSRASRELLSARLTFGSWRTSTEKLPPHSLSGLCEGAFCSCWVVFILGVLVRLDRELSALRLSRLLLLHSELRRCAVYFWGIFTAFTNRQNNKFSRRENKRAGEGRVWGGQLGELLNFIHVITVLCNTRSAIWYTSAFFLSSYLANLQWHLIELELPAHCGVGGGPLSAQHAALSKHMQTHSDEQCNDWQRAPGRRTHWQMTLTTFLSMFLSAHLRQTTAVSEKKSNKK